MGFLASVVQGSTIVFPSPQFQADQVLESIHQERCTALLGVPTMFIAMLEANKKKGYKISTVRTGLAAGSSVPAVLMKQLRQEFGVEDMLIAYGMTETSPVTFLASLDDSNTVCEKDHQISSHATLCGLNVKLDENSSISSLSALGQNPVFSTSFERAMHSMMSPENSH